jgi:rubrerythrin
MSKEESTPYSFKGDNAKLVDSIKSLLALDSKGALVPHGVCGLARQLLESAVERLAVDAQPVAWMYKENVWATGLSSYVWREKLELEAPGAESEIKDLAPLFTRSDAGEVDRLNTVVEQMKREAKNDAIAYRAAIEKQEELRQDLELTRLARQGDQIEIDGLKALCDGFRAQLADAAQSLETISLQAGRDEFMKDMTQVRGYANSRARVARGALSAIAEQKCETCHDQGEVFVSKGKVEYGMLTEPEPIYKPCPDCAEPANKERAQ